jgi:hypothetical protein
MYMSVILAVSSLFTGLAGYSVDSGITRGARKLIGIPRLIKKKREAKSLKEVELSQA